MSSDSDANPYAVTFDEDQPTQEQLNYVRNIDAICTLYFLSLIHISEPTRPY